MKYNHKILQLFFILNFIMICSVLSSQSLPKPKNYQLYTEFTSQRIAPYLKKPITAEGYIVMNGTERFTFKQIKPTLIEIRKTDGKIIYKRENMEPIVIDGTLQTNDSDNIMFLFSDNQKLTDQFKISLQKIDQKDQYEVTPKKADKVENIIITAVEDKIENIRIQFLNKSILIYQFKNTVTGVIPDENLF